MASIYTLDSETLTIGLGGSDTTNEAILVAQQLADRRGEDVHLDDDDGEWLVHPMVDCVREPADPIE